MKATNVVLGTLLISCLAGCTKSEEEEPTTTNTEAVEGEEAAPAAAAGGAVVDTSGTLEEGDLVYPEDNSYYDEYKFEAKSGDTIVVSMDSEAFDTYLHLLGPGDLQEMNDDHGDDESTNSRITYVATQDGEYTVFANSLWAPEECAPATPGDEASCAFGGAYNITVTVGQ